MINAMYFLLSLNHKAIPGYLTNQDMLKIINVKNDLPLFFYLGLY